MTTHVQFLGRGSIKTADKQFSSRVLLIDYDNAAQTCLMMEPPLVVPKNTTVVVFLGGDKENHPDFESFPSGVKFWMPDSSVSQVADCALCMYVGVLVCSSSSSRVVRIVAGEDKRYLGLKAAVEKESGCDLRIIDPDPKKISSFLEKGKQSKQPKIGETNGSRCQHCDHRVTTQTIVKHEAKCRLNMACSFCSTRIAPNKMDKHLLRCTKIKPKPKAKQKAKLKVKATSDIVSVPSTSKVSVSQDHIMSQCSRCSSNVSTKNMKRHMHRQHQVDSNQ